MHVVAFRLSVITVQLQEKNYFANEIGTGGCETRPRPVPLRGSLLGNDIGPSLLPGAAAGTGLGLGCSSGRAVHTHRCVTAQTSSSEKIILFYFAKKRQPR